MNFGLTQLQYGVIFFLQHIFKIKSIKKGILYFCWLVGFAYTFYQITESIIKYFQYESTMSARDLFDLEGLPFPNILVCS